MTTRYWLQVALAALVIALAGAVAALAGDTEVKVTNDGSQHVKVVRDGDTTYLTLDDLKDGETRTFGGDDHSVTVTRHGDRLDVTVDGEALDLSNVAGKGDETTTHSVIVVRTKDKDKDKDKNVKVEKRVMVFAGDDLDAKQRRVTVMNLDEDAPGLLHVFGDRVVLRCPKDGAELVLKPDQVGDKTFKCPLCGATMEKAEPPESGMSYWVEVGKGCDHKKK